MVVEAKRFGKSLSGRLNGKKHFGQVCDLLSSLGQGEIATLDFKGVEYVTASWISAMLVPLIRRGAEETNDFFIVLANFPEDSIDDLQLVAEQTRVPFLVKTHKAATTESVRLVGILDGGQRSTLAAVMELGETTGADLERQRPADRTKATAWNNRLRDLFEKRLLRRRKQGREQFYTPVILEVTFNG